ncbi:MAG: hypothetical protein HY692_09785 [Cyanobacteria bacterium NC_groundwater_1444_Ag_S-0.65um_54_12]|nr:hypothetical protein [Cyanobacteria bacterium NC_groundwater_1444_Ag_S-0.65um_54_12]
MDRWLARLLLSGLLVGSCANGVTLPLGRQNLVFRFQVQGQLSQDPGIRYLFAVDVSGNPGDGPKPFGTWAKDLPTIGWDLPIYLGPNVRNVSLELPSNIQLETNVWTDVFILSNVAGQERVDHFKQLAPWGRDPNVRSTIVQQPALTADIEWRLLGIAGSSQPGVANPLNTLELNLPFPIFFGTNPTDTPKEIEANLIVQAIPPAGYADLIRPLGPDGKGWKIDQWNPADNVYFSLSTDKLRGVDRKDAPHSQALFSQNIPSGVPPADVTLKSYTSEVK